MQKNRGPALVKLGATTKPTDNPGVDNVGELEQCAQLEWFAQFDTVSALCTIGKVFASVKVDCAECRVLSLSSTGAIWLNAANHPVILRSGTWSPVPSFECPPRPMSLSK